MARGSRTDVGKENAESNAGDDRAAKRARGSPFGDDHVELVELLGRIGVEPPRDDATSAASPRLVVASALETRMAAQQAVLDDDTKTSLLAALAALWDTSERWLRMCLSPSVASDGGAADSLVKILLRVDALQPALIETLLERVVAIASEAFDTDAPLSDSTPRLVLAHVRWLEAVADPASLVVKLLQVLDVCPAALQREVVALVPEVAEDAQHELIVDTLHELIVQDSSFTIPVLHALSGLQLPADLAGRVMAMLVSALPSAASADLPSLVRSLLQSAPRDAVATAVKELRAHVRVEPATAAAELSHEPQLIDALASSVQFRREVAAALLAELDAAEWLSALDVWLLCALHGGGSTSAARKLTERAFVRKAASGALAARVARDAVVGHGAALRAHFRSLLAFAAACVRCAQHSLARELGCALYAAAFREFGGGADGSASAGGAFYRSELVSALLSHGGSGVPSEVDSGLAVMWALAQDQVGALQPHSALLSTQLDHLDALSLAQTRRLFCVFGALALEPDGVSRGRRGDELAILVRKMLTAVDLGHKKRGLAAALALVEQLCPMAAGDGDAAEPPPPPAAAAAEATSLLEAMGAAAARDWRCAAFMATELSRAVRERRLHVALVLKLKEQSLDSFERVHLIDLSTLDRAALPAVGGLQAALLLNADGDDADVCVDLLLSLAKAKGDGSGGARGGSTAADAVHSICATFGLLCETTAFTDGSLAEVDAILGCPILGFAPADVLGRFEALPTDARELACACLFAAVDWLRSLLCNFARELVRTGDTDTAAKLCARLEALCGLELALERHAAQTPSFVAGLAFRHSLGDGKPGRRAAKPAAKPKHAKDAAAKPHDDDDDDDAADADASAAAAAPAKPKAKGGGVRKKAAAKSGGGIVAAKGAAANGLPTGSLHDWPTMPTLSQLAAVLRPLGLHTSVMLALQQAKDCDSLGETLHADGASVRSLELSPAAVHALVCAMHAHLAAALQPAGRGPFGQAAAGAAGAADDGAEGAAAGEAALSPDEALAQSILGLRAFPFHLGALMEIIDSGGRLADDAVARLAGRAADDDDADDDDDDNRQPAGGLAAASACAELSDARALERVPARLQASYAVPAVSAMLRSLRLVFASTHLRQPDSPSRAHVAALLRVFAQSGGGASAPPPPSAHPTDAELAELAEGACGYFEALQHSLPCGTTAVDLLDLLGALAQVAPAKSAARAALAKRAAVAAQLPLGRAWASHMPKPRGAQISRLFQTALSSSADAREQLDDWVHAVLPQFLEQVTATCDGEGYAATQPLLSTKTIHLFYKPLTDQLIVAVRALELPADAGALKALGERELSAAVDSIAAVIELFAGLVSPSKCLDNNSSFIAQILRMSRRFLESFNKQAMPFFMLAFSHAEQREAIANALKRLQTSTRMIQSHCAQSKASCAVGALAQLPHVKKQLESLVFNVKHMLADNECSAAFWMGNLKHKTAAGVPVGSQVEPPAAKAKAAKAAPAKRGKKALAPAREEEEDLDDDDDDAAGGDDDEGSGEEDEDAYPADMLAGDDDESEASDDDDDDA